MNMGTTGRRQLNQCTNECLGLRRLIAATSCSMHSHDQAAGHVEAIADDLRLVSSFPHSNTHEPTSILQTALPSFSEACANHCLVRDATTVPSLAADGLADVDPRARGIVSIGLHHGGPGRSEIDSDTGRQLDGCYSARQGQQSCRNSDHSAPKAELDRYIASKKQRDEERLRRDEERLRRDEERLRRDEERRVKPARATEAQLELVVKEMMQLTSLLSAAVQALENLNARDCLSKTESETLSSRQEQAELMREVCRMVVAAVEGLQMHVNGGQSNAERLRVDGLDRNMSRELCGLDEASPASDDEAKQDSVTKI